MITQWLLGGVTICSSTAIGVLDHSWKRLDWSIVPSTHLRRTRPREASSLPEDTHRGTGPDRNTIR